MPPVLDISTLVHTTETQDLRPAPTRPAPRSFWSTLMQSIRRDRGRQLTSRTSHLHTRSLYPMESPEERLARQSPYLYLQAFAGAS